MAPPADPIVVDRLDQVLGDPDRAIANFFTLGHFFVSQSWGRRRTCAFFEMTRCCPLLKQRSVQCRRVAPSWFILYGRLR